MSRKTTLAVAGGFALLLLTVLTLSYISRPADDHAPADLDTPDANEIIVEPGEALLYFPGRKGRLYPERRAIGAEIAGEARLQLIVEKLLAGPEDELLQPALPPHVELAGVTLDTDGTLYLDLGSKEGPLRGLGSTSELLAVYSLVDTVLINEPRAQRVVLMWNGRQQPSLAGHVDTTRALTIDRRLVAEDS